jgi:hypothetical protein
MIFNPVVGRHTFPDGRSVPVYEDGAGRRYIIDKDGWRCYGPWLPTDPPDVEDATDLRAGDETGL